MSLPAPRETLAAVDSSGAVEASASVAQESVLLSHAVGGHISKMRPWWYPVTHSPGRSGHWYAASRLGTMHCNGAVGSFPFLVRVQ